MGWGSVTHENQTCLPSRPQMSDRSSMISCTQFVSVASQEKMQEKKGGGPREATEPTEGLYETHDQTALDSLERTSR